MHIIIRGEFVLVFCQTSLSISLSPETLRNVISLRCLGKPRGVYFRETRWAAISEQWHSRKKISIINTPQAILLLMFILHTFMGALSKSKMCWKWSKGPGNHPIIIIIFISRKSPPWPCKVSHLYFYPGQSFTKSLSCKRENIWSQNCWCRSVTPLVVDWNPFRIHNYVWFMFLITDPGIDGPGFM